MGTSRRLLLRIIPILVPAVVGTKDERTRKQEKRKRKAFPLEINMQVRQTG